jgi:hypothetical protein
LKAEQNRVREKVKAVVYGSPILNLYAQQYGTSLAWDVSEMLWTTRADAPIPAEVKYVLIPAFVYNHMPPEHPMRRVVAEHWKVVWSFKADHVWELRLYEKPQATNPAPALAPGLQPAKILQRREGNVVIMEGF